MEGNESTTISLLENSAPTATKSRWPPDVIDLLILFGSCVLTGVSITIVTLIFYAEASYYFQVSGPSSALHETLKILQRPVSALSTTFSSALILVVGKRYVLFKFGREGIRSQRVALYSHPSIGRLAFHLVRRGFEIPLFALAVVWALGLAAGLTVNDAWGMVESNVWLVPSGPVDPQLNANSFDPMTTVGPVDPILFDELQLMPFFDSPSDLLGNVTALVFSGLADSVGVISMGNMPELASGSPSGVLFYPPLPNYVPSIPFSVSTQLNGFNISMEQLSSIPHTAQGLTCVGWDESNFTTGQLWYEGGDDQSLSIIARSLYDPQSMYRFNASAVLLPGVINSTGNATEFTWNGTMLPNVMSSNNWTLDITRLVCNATGPIGGCGISYTLGGAKEQASGCPLIDFAEMFNAQQDSSLSPNSSAAVGAYWSTALGMAMGAYSSVMCNNYFAFDLHPQEVSKTLYGNPNLQFKARHGTYILIANIVASIAMVSVALKLRNASDLNADFIDSTRLLMDPLRDPEMFNSSLDTTIKAHGNPYMRVSHGEFVLAEEALPKREKDRKRRRCC